MSDNHDYLRPSDDPTFRLRSDVLMLMLRGAGYAAVFCLIVGFFIGATVGIGKLLPPESKEADDPTPFSYMLTSEKTTRT